MLAQPFPTVPEFPLIIPDGQGGWKSHERASECSREQVAAWVQTEVAYCAASPLYFLNHFCQTIDEGQDAKRGDPSYQPSVALIPDLPHIRAIIGALWPARNVAMLKTRRMLGTWTLMACVLHDLLFRKNWSVMTLSRIESLVDDGGENSTHASMHGKIRFLWEHLPPFLRGWDMEFRSLRIRNKDTNSFVQGYASSHSPGRGSGFQRAILDEFAQLQHSEQTMASVGPACPNGKVLLSTPRGEGNAFCRIYREQARHVFPVLEPPDPKKHWEGLFLHWSTHPMRADGKWKAREIARNAMTAEMIAQELEGDFLGSKGKRVYPKYVEEKHRDGASLCDIGAIYHPDRPLNLCCDFNYDPLVWELVQIWHTAPLYRVVGEICRRDAMFLDGVWEFIVRFGNRTYVEKLFANHPGWDSIYGGSGICVAGDQGHRAPVVIYGDATEEKSTHMSRVKTYDDIVGKLREAGFTVSRKVPPSNPPIARRIELHNDALDRNLIVVATECEELRKDYLRGTWDRAQKDMDQLHEDDDGTHLTRSHGSSAFGYFLARHHKVGTSGGAASRTPEDRTGSPKSLGSDFIKSWNRPVRR